MSVFLRRFDSCGTVTVLLPAEAEPAANRILNSGRREIRGAYGCNTSMTGRTGIGRSGFVWNFRLFYS